MLRDDEVHVWETSGLTRMAADAAVLSSDERERADRFRQAEHRARWVAARVCLRTILARYMGQAASALTLETDSRGKPRLVGSTLTFNLSHSGDVALYAIARDHEVGVDVELMRPVRDMLGIVRRTMPGLLRELDNAADEERLPIFYRAWVHHEARLKCLGIGLGGVDRADADAAPVTVFDVDCEPGYMGAVAVGAKTAVTRTDDLSPELMPFPQCRGWAIRRISS